MSRFVPYAFGVALALSPAIVCAQTNNGNTRPNYDSSSSQTTTQTNQNSTSTKTNGTTTPATNNNMTSPAANNAGTANRAMPNTAANWLPALFGGSLLAGAGVSLRRRYSRES